MLSLIRLAKNQEFSKLDVQGQSASVILDTLSPLDLLAIYRIKYFSSSLTGITVGRSSLEFRKQKPCTNLVRDCIQVLFWSLNIYKASSLSFLDFFSYSFMKFSLLISVSPVAAYKHKTLMLTQRKENTIHRRRRLSVTKALNENEGNVVHRVH